MASKGCIKACLYEAGRGAMQATKDGRLRKTRWYFSDRAAFMATLHKDILAAIRYADKRGYDIAIRLNATSDIPWHRILHDGKSMMEHFPQVQFYDYTKVAKRLISEQLPANYHLTFSVSESNRALAQGVLNAGGSVAAVFRDAATRDKYMGTGFLGYPVVDGDETDLRFLDPANVVVGLYAKGTKGKRDDSGFVID
jgi:predicted DNA-binding WGR domain protein